MDYPLHYSAEDNRTHPNNHSENYRNYSVFNDRSDIMLYDNNNSNNNNSTTSTSPTMDNTLDLKQQQNRSRSMLLMSTRPNIMHDPWNISTTNNNNTNNNNNNNNNQHSIQPHHSMNTTEFNQAMTNNSLHHNFPQAERGIAGFVSKLYQCLQSNDTSQKYARWCHHEGKDMFIIDCIPEFTETVLPRLFKHCKFPSFVRQLNIYGFQRDTDARKSKDTKDKESCRWYHPCFRPGRRDLFHLIRRKATRYSRKKRVKAEEDPETILNLGSGDESDSNNLNDDENIILLVNQDDSNNEQRCSSSTTSSVHNSTTPIEYHPQLHHTISYHANTTTPILLDTPTVLNQPQQEESDNAEDIIPNNNLIVDIHPPSSNNVMHEQDLRLQLYQMKRHYEKMQGYFEEQLNTAQIQIDEQKLRIQRLEETLRFTTPKANVKLNTTNSYISATNNYNNYNNNNRLVNQQRSFIDLQHLNKSTTEASTPRPTTTPDDDFNHNSNFYFHENQKIVQIKTENDNRHHHLLHTTPPPSSTNTNSNTSGSNTWNTVNHHHRDTTSGMVAAGSNTTPHSSSSIIDNENHNNSNNNNRSNNNNNTATATPTAKSTLPIHMNFNTYM